MLFEYLLRLITVTQKGRPAQAWYVYARHILSLLFSGICFAGLQTNYKNKILVYYVTEYASKYNLFFHKHIILYWYFWHKIMCTWLNVNSFLSFCLKTRSPVNRLFLKYKNVASGSTISKLDWYLMAMPRLITGLTWLF